MGKATSASTLELGRQTASGPEMKVLRNLHETFAREFSAGLSTLLQSETVTTMGEIGFVQAADFRNSLPTPSCLVTLKLHPRPERMILYLDSPTVLGLLEIMLGGTGDSTPATPRELTEIEWSLLEEVVRVLVRNLGEAWKTIFEVEFDVESLGSDPTALICPDPALVRIGFHLQAGQQTGTFELAFPRVLFAAAAQPAEQQEVSTAAPEQGDFERNLALLQNAQVELEVRLQGPTLAVNEILGLKAGQVITFDYALNKPLHGLVNGDLTIMGRVVGAGRKRAFQVDQLP